MNKKKNILITGPPGIGKTTLIKKVSLQVQDLHPAGFYTQEIRENSNRMGFEIIGLAGQRGILAHMNHRGPYRVGKYGVDINGFEKYLSSLRIESTCQLVIIDEIGRMECYSEVFRNMVKDYLDSDRPFLATISLKGYAYIDGIKKRDDVKLYQVTRENRDTLVMTLVSEILQMMR